MAAVDSDGLVYLIQAGDLGPMKIGSTRNARSLENRLRKLQTGSPERLWIRAVGSGGGPRERVLHKRFAAQRLYGEWFEVDEELWIWASYGMPPELQAKEPVDVVEAFREFLEFSAPVDVKYLVNPLPTDPTQ